MEFSYQIIFIGSLLLIFSILITSFSSRIGIPVLLVFLVIGMMAGKEGIGTILFYNVPATHLIGTLALAIILFDAGLRTTITILRAGLLPALSLSTLGIIITSFIAGLSSIWLLHLPWLEGLLIGVIVGPTDAAAVFSALRASRLRLKASVSATLEIESSSNDPLAVIFTLLLIAAISSQTSLSFILLWKLPQQVLTGMAIGLAVGWIMVRLNNWIKLETGLYPLLVLAGGMAIFAATDLLGGSGYLAVYLAGIVIGNSTTYRLENILVTHDSLAWLSQITMFLTLGLLVKPSSLLPAMPQALSIGLILIFLARPLAVWISLLPFHFNWREQVFVAWVGLRGSVPVVLALYPLLAGLTHAQLYFNIVFFIVVLSISLQGWGLIPLARWLKLEVSTDDQENAN